jgi:hypothetical protein
MVMKRMSSIAASVAFLAMAGLAGPADAKIETSLNHCKGENGVMQLCPVYRPSFAPPKGWSTDKESAAAQGVSIFVPPGKTFRNAPALIYGEARPNPEKIPLAQWIANSDGRWLQSLKGSKIEELPAGDLGAGKREVIVHRYVNPSKNQPVEIIGYFAENDADGNAYVVRLTLSGLSAKAVEAARPLFDETLKAY